MDAPRRHGRRLVSEHLTQIFLRALDRIAAFPEPLASVLEAGLLRSYRRLRDGQCKLEDVTE